MVEGGLTFVEILRNDLELILMIWDALSGDFEFHVIKEIHNWV
jgi:hypothetical protein